KDARFVSIVSGPRILEFEFVALSADSIVIAYLRGACTHWDRHIHLFYVSSYETRARCSLTCSPVTRLRLLSVGTSYTRWPYVPLFHSSANSGGASSRGRLQELISSIACKAGCFVILYAAPVGIKHKSQQHRGGSESKFREGKVES
ncbi:hypothetical protein ALC57_00529, partial [Trachymyrmex cornetzi]